MLALDTSLRLVSLIDADRREIILDTTFVYATGTCSLMNLNYKGQNHFFSFSHDDCASEDADKNDLQRE